MSKQIPQPIELMIAGAQKSGTTSLLRYLAQHPKVCAHEQREMDFFVRDATFAQGYESVFLRFFRCEPEQQILMAKSAVLMYSKVAIQRLKEHNPHAQVVLLLRHPIDRAYSQYWYSLRRGWEELKTFEEAIEAGPRGDADTWLNCAYIECSLYVEALSCLLSCFDAQQVHVFLLEDMKQDAGLICQQLYSLFAEIDDHFAPYLDAQHNLAATHHNRYVTKLTSSRSTLPSLKRLLRRHLPGHIVDRVRDRIQRLNESEFVVPPMNPQTRVKLGEYFRPHNARLGEMLGRDLSQWNT